MNLTREKIDIPQKYPDPFSVPNASTAPKVGLSAHELRGTTSVSWLGLFLRAKRPRVSNMKSQSNYAHRLDSRLWI